MVHGVYRGWISLVNPDAVNRDFQITIFARKYRRLALFAQGIVLRLNCCDDVSVYLHFI